MNNEKCLIVGADKMLGHALVAQLRNNPDHQVILVQQDRLDWYSFKQVTALMTQYAPSTLVCLLGKSGGIALNQAAPADLMLDNLLIVLNVMRACQRVNIQKAVFLGSSCMYPSHTLQPMHERLLFSGYLEPTSQSYAVAKLALLQLCEAFNQQYGTHFICAIPSSMYGPHDDFDQKSAHVVGALINKFHHAQVNQVSQVTVWGSGLPSRELIYVDDVARAIIRCLAKDVSAKNNPINVGYGGDISIKALAEMIAKTVGFSGQMLWDRSQSDGVSQKRLDNSQLTSLGWSAQISVEQGLELTYQWYLYASAEAHDQISV